MDQEPLNESADRAGNTRANFIRAIIEDDLASGRFTSIVTRFPPEPNGYLHIGHAKAICVGFGLAAQYGGRCHLRFDDTNPVAEDVEFTNGIQEDIRWLGFDWGEHLYHASDYFQQLYDWAVGFVKDGRAYVDSLSEDDIRIYRGTVTEPGRPSPFRDRPVDESLRLLDEMRRGLHPEGSHVLRAKGDLASPNMKMRDPLLYRILLRDHDRTGSTWRIYPMYDWAHGPSDAIEGITHSICTLEFDNNRALYDLFLDMIGFAEPRPHQYEMARLNLPYTMMSKRRLRALVQEGVVDGWDDPRMPTIRALRKRGVPPEAIRAFVERVGVAKTNSVIDPVLLDNAIRDTLNDSSKRLMAVFDPLPLELTNWPEGEVDWLDASLYPHDVPLEGTRKVPFTRTILVERSDFAEVPPKGWHRMSPGGEIRLRYAYLVAVTEVRKDASGAVIGLVGRVDLDSRGGAAADGRKVKGTIHWVSQDLGRPIGVRLYERLFTHEAPDTVEDFRSVVNPHSKRELVAVAEPALFDEPAGSRVQLERNGYFYAEPERFDAQPRGFTRVVPLKDSWTVADTPVKAPAPASIDARATPTERIYDVGERALIAVWASRGVGDEEALVLGARPDLAALFEGAVGASPAELARWVVHEVPRALGERALSDARLAPSALGRLVELVGSGAITHRIARDVLAVLTDEGGSPDAVIDARGWRTIGDDGALVAAVDAVLAENPAELEAWRGGKDRLAGFFVGQIMKRTQGRADARRVQELLAERRGG